jgi:hypothetical protein
MRRHFGVVAQELQIRARHLDDVLRGQISEADIQHAGAKVEGLGVLHCLQKPSEFKRVDQPKH